MAVITTNKTCLRKAKNQLEKHQMGFDGEHIGEVVLRRLGYKGVKLTSHKSKFDILTAREAWEIKTVGRDALDKKMSIKAKQKVEKLAWAKKNRKSPKSMMVIVNDSAEVYVRDGLGKFRSGGMKKVATYKDWRKEVGHGRTTRAVQGTKKQAYIFRDGNVQGVYESQMEIYSKWEVDDFKKKFKMEVGPELTKSLDEWGASTNTVEAIALKFKSETLEAITGKVRVSTLRLVRAEKARELAKRYIDNDDYVRLRALTQAYYKKTGKKTIKLWRGIDGNSGDVYRKQLQELWTKAEAQGTSWKEFIEQTITIKEDAVTGWTTDRVLAKSFGGGTNGILVEKTIDVKDILVSDDIWLKKETLIGEHEFLVKGGTYEIKIGDILFGF